jgi:hypothetical protein
MKKNSLVAQHSIFYVVLCAMLFGLCSVAEAQQTKKVYRVGFLTPSTGKSQQLHTTQSRVPTVKMEPYRKTDSVL